MLSGDGFAVPSHANFGARVMDAEDDTAVR